MPAISVIMPCYNRAHDLARTLRAYDRQDTAEPFEIIAVDDASSDQTYAVLTAYQPSRYALRVERMPQNRGPAATRNRGLELAEAPLILIVGDDILPAQDFIRGHLAAHRHHREPEVAILGQVLWPPDLPCNTLMAHIDGIGAQQFSYHYLQEGHEYDFRHFYTANISIKRSLLDSLDRWFDTDFRYAAYEDAELAYRLSKRGMRIRYTAAVKGYHYHYHNIWSFAIRQRRTGEMARVLTAKHPELRYTFRAQYLRLANLFREYRSFWKPFIPEILDRVEAFTNQLASFYEWHANKLLDQLYLGVLDYHYYDGVIRGHFGQRKLGDRLRSAHASRYLIPTLKRFIQQASEEGIPIPQLPPPHPILQTHH